MTSSELSPTALRVADLAQNTSTPFDLKPDAEEMARIADELGLLGLRKLRLAGNIQASGKRDWVLEARLGATVTQACVVTLEPVTTRIDTAVSRRFVADWTTPEDEEVEMHEDDSVEALGTQIDPGQVMIEALSLALPLYPRKDGAELGEAVYTRPGEQPMRDEDAKPFAKLAELRNALKKDD
ncbi:YceD family protein [Primorskyibacter sp. S87]|uniref:YceD family protein n=1 Tax=Primorskyibacter sp. S87 TaxID=3415126 RepID=UPI003C7E1198